MRPRGEDTSTVNEYDITLLTEAGLPAMTPDDQLLRQALEARGSRVRVAVWNDPEVDWSRSTLTVFRSTWDYFYHVERFMAWLERAESQTRIINDPATIRWNAHKSYLADLERRGVTIVPTLFAARDNRVDVQRTCAERGWDAIVVKPCVGGSAHGAQRFDLTADAQHAQDHLDALLATGEALVQPYLPAVETERERSLIFFDGAFSHAIRKVPFSTLASYDATVAYEPKPSETEFAERALAAAGGPFAYGRVDLVPHDDSLLLMELELIEPSLSFAFADGAADRFAAVIERRLGDAYSGPADVLNTV